MALDRRSLLVGCGLVGIFVFSLFVRTYWYVDTAVPNGDFLLPESDSYYQHRTVESIQANQWQQPVKDPLLNYPLGGVNPNPPLWDWWLSAWGAILSPLFAGDAANHPVNCAPNAAVPQNVCVSTWWVTEFSPALFGALTVLFVMLIGRELWNWPAGLMAGFFAATSTSAIDNTFFGNARHYSFILFFIVLTFYFYLCALRARREARWIERWSQSESLWQGLKAYARANTLSLSYGFMSALALAAVGLAWKGSAYAVVILFAAGLVQVFVNHLRRSDPIEEFFLLSVVLVGSTLLVLPYYLNPALSAVSDTVLPLAFLTLAWLILGLIFTAGRDLPFVLVLPLTVGVGLAAAGVAFFVVPSVATTLLAPLIYFRQTSLYTTIAEAHSASFDNLVFGTGVAAFFIALLVIPILFWENRKRWNHQVTVIVMWAVISIYMAESAVRFLFNATPVFAVLAGYGTSRVLRHLRFDKIAKNVRGLGGLSRTSLRKSVTLGHVAGATLIALVLILPNVLLAVDAGTPPGSESKLLQGELRGMGVNLSDSGAVNENRSNTFVSQRLGAFGQGFISDYWKNLFEWMQTQDANLAPKDRPAFISWWDYGHWAVSLGHHPTAADNFQNGYKFAGNYFVSQNETQDIQLLIARIADRARFGQISPDVITGAFQRAGLSASDAKTAYDALLPPDATPNCGQPWNVSSPVPAGCTVTAGAFGAKVLTSNCPPQGRPQGCAGYGFAPQLSLDQAAQALRAIETATGDRLRYFAVDVRLYPYDVTSTPSIDAGSIFYAPVVLSAHSTEDYIPQVIKLPTPLTRGKCPNLKTGQQAEFTPDEFSELRKDLTCQIDTRGATELYNYPQAFYNTSFYRTWIGTPPGYTSVPATACAGPPQTFPTTGDALPGLPLPGFCMKHFRLVYFDSAVRMVRYYEGAVVQGQIALDGQPLSGATVRAYDDAGDLLFDYVAGLQLRSGQGAVQGYPDAFRQQFGRDLSPRDLDVPHDSVLTDGSGRYSVVAPFGTRGPITIRAFKDGVEIANRTLNVSGDQAERGDIIAAQDMAVRSGSVGGKVFFDANANDHFDVGEQELSGAKVQIDGNASNEATTDASGNYSIAKVSPGRHEVTATAEAYEMSQSAGQSAVTVRADAASTMNVPMALAKVPVIGTAWRDANGDRALQADEGVPEVALRATPDFRLTPNTAEAAFGASGDNGTISLDATPGSYILSGQWKNPDGNATWVLGTLIAPSRGQVNLALSANATLLLPSATAVVNLTWQLQPGNFSGAANAQVLFIPTQGGLAAAANANATGGLNATLAPGSYQMYAKATAPDGSTWTLAQPKAFDLAASGASPVVQAELVKA